MAAWLMLSLKTHTFGPTAATVASGQRDEVSADAATLDPATSQRPPAMAIAVNAARGRRTPRFARCAVVRFKLSPRRTRANLDGLAVNMSVSRFMCVSMLRTLVLVYIHSIRRVNVQRDSGGVSRRTATRRGKRARHQRRSRNHSDGHR